MRTWKLATAGLLMGGMVLTATGCGVKEYINCRNICSKKRECGPNSNYNVDVCVDSCSQRADDSDEYARQVNTCKECLDPLSCTDPRIAGCFASCPSLP